jgi:hypothetical protein
VTDDVKRILLDKQFHLQLKSEQKEIIQNVLERKDSMAVLPTGFQYVAVIIQLVSRDHACRFESETEMVKRLGLCWSVKFAVFFMESALTSHGSSKSNKKPSDGRGILDYDETCYN